MAALIITPDDLQAFKKELLQELNELLQKQSKQTDTKWLKSKEVRERLNISPGTLQNLRLKGTLPYTRIGGVLYYDASDIERVLEQNRSQQPEA